MDACVENGDMQEVAKQAHDLLKNVLSCKDPSDQEPKIIRLDENSLQRQLEAERKARVDACGAAIQEVLARYNCEMFPRLVFAGSQYTADIMVKSK